MLFGATGPMSITRVAFLSTYFFEGKGGVYWESLMTNADNLRTMFSQTFKVRLSRSALRTLRSWSLSDISMFSLNPGLYVRVEHCSPTFCYSLFLRSTLPLGSGRFSIFLNIYVYFVFFKYNCLVLFYCSSLQYSVLRFSLELLIKVTSSKSVCLNVLER